MLNPYFIEKKILNINKLNLKDNFLIILNYLKLLYIKTIF